MPANGELNLDDSHPIINNTASIQDASRVGSPIIANNSLSDDEIINHHHHNYANNASSSDEDDHNQIKNFQNYEFFQNKNNKMLLANLQNFNLNGININDKNHKQQIEYQPRWISHSNRQQHGEFIKKSIENIVNTAVFKSTERDSKLSEWHDPNELQKIFDMSVKSSPDSDDKLYELIDNIVKYSVKTGHPYFINQLYSSLDPYAFVGQLLTDALNPSVYTYEVAPVFILMEEIVLKEMRKIVGFPNDGEGDGIFCPGGSIANGYSISCARHKFMPDIKMKGLCGLPRLIVFASEDAHYSVQKLSSFMGIGIDNVYKIKTDKRGKMCTEHLLHEIERAKNEGALPFLIFTTAGTTVFGAYDPIEKCANIAEKHNIWLHVDAAWGGGALMSTKYRNLLKGIERADSVTWNPHKMLSSAQQCSTFLTRHKSILGECHSTNAAYLFQKDKFYDTKYDTGDKHIQCGRRADVLKFWFMWRAKGTDGLTAHIEHIFEMSEYFTSEIKKRNDFEMVLEEPECTNISFWYIPPSLINMEKNAEYYERLHKVAPKIKERMMKEGAMMITYQSIKNIPNFFRLVLQNSALDKIDMKHFISEIVRLGEDL